MPDPQNAYPDLRRSVCVVMSSKQRHGPGMEFEPLLSKDRNVTCVLISGYMHSYLQCEPGLEPGEWPISRREKSTIWPAASALKDGTVVTLCAVPL